MKRLFVFLCSIFLIGCAGFRENTLNDEMKVQSAKASEKFVLVNVDYMIDTKILYPKRMMAEDEIRYRQECEKLFRNTMINEKVIRYDKIFISDLSEHIKNSKDFKFDLLINITIKQVIEGDCITDSLWQGAAGMTLLLIPYRQVSIYTMDALIYRANGEIVKSYNLKEKVSYWFSLFLMPMMYSHWPFSVENEIYSSMYHVIINDMIKNSIL